jgi:hypothetical protein
MDFEIPSEFKSLGDGERFLCMDEEEQGKRILGAGPSSPSSLRLESGGAGSICVRAWSAKRRR